jgi:hypothetical protein
MDGNFRTLRGVNMNYWYSSYRIFVFTIGIAVFLAGCKAKLQPRKEIYSWISFEVAPKDSAGKLMEVPAWDGPHRIPGPAADTFVIYSNNDSIRMITADVPGGNLFTRFELHGYRWRPKPSYLDRLFLLGTYMRNDLPGIYATFYVSKDWKTLLQVHYTNPGNMNMALYFSRDSVNIFRQADKIVDPNEDVQESEKPVVAGENH